MGARQSGAATPWDLVVGVCFFFFNDTATTEIYTLSLHDALPIYVSGATRGARRAGRGRAVARAARPRRQARERARGRGAAVCDRQGQGGTWNAERGTGDGWRVCRLTAWLPGRDRGYAGRPAARLARPPAARAGVQHGADRPVDRRGPERRGGAGAGGRRTAPGRATLSSERPPQQRHGEKRQRIEDAVPGGARRAD